MLADAELEVHHRRVRERPRHVGENEERSAEAVGRLGETRDELRESGRGLPAEPHRTGASVDQLDVDQWSGTTAEELRDERAHLGNLLETFIHRSLGFAERLPNLPVPREDGTVPTDLK